MRESNDLLKIVQALESTKHHESNDIGNFAALDAESF
jgi:hypothetical protein